MDRVYRIVPLDGHELVQPVDTKDYAVLTDLIDGTERSATWSPIGVRLIRKDGEEPLLRSDSPWLSPGTLVLRDGAVAHLAEQTADNAELLPLDCVDGDFWLVNVTTVLDALDTSASSLVRFGDGRVITVRHFAFLEERLDEAQMFKIPDMKVSDIFVGDAFVDAWRAASLEGIGFETVWRRQPG